LRQKQKLSARLDKVESGEEVQITRNCKPVARIVGNEDVAIACCKKLHKSCANLQKALPWAAFLGKNCGPARHYQL
jgi:prevent-host-death family protein